MSTFSGGSAALSQKYLPRGPPRRRAIPHRYSPGEAKRTVVQPAHPAGVSRYLQLSGGKVIGAMRLDEDGDGAKQLPQLRTAADPVCVIVVSCRRCLVRFIRIICSRRRLPTTSGMYS